MDIMFLDEIRKAYTMYMQAAHQVMADGVKDIKDRINNIDDSTMLLIRWDGGDNE